MNFNLYFFDKKNIIIDFYIFKFTFIFLNWCEFVKIYLMSCVLKISEKNELSNKKFTKNQRPKENKKVLYFFNNCLNKEFS